MKILPPIVFASPLLAFANFDYYGASINLIRIKKAVKGATFAVHSTVKGIESSLHKSEELARSKFARNIASAIKNGHTVDNSGTTKN